MDRKPALSGLMMIIICACNTSSHSNKDWNEGPPAPKSTLQAEYYFNIQEYEKAVARYDQLIGKRSASPQVILDAKLQLARLYYETRQFEKSSLLYDEVVLTNWKEVAFLTEKDINNTIDLEKRLGHITNAKSVVAKYEPIIPFNTRFVNLKKSLEKYNEGFLKGDSTIARATMLNFNLPGYQYGLTTYRNGIVFISNFVDERKLKTIYGNSRMYFLANNDLQPFSTSLNFLIQAGPASFYNNGNQVVYTTNRYGAVKTEKMLNINTVNETQLFAAAYNEEKKKWGRADGISDWLPRGKSRNYSFMHPMVKEDGSRLYFSSNMPGGFGGADIYYSDWDAKNKTWKKPVNMGSKVNTNGDELYPFLYKDYLLFSSNGHMGYGGLDVFVINPSDSKGLPVHLPYPVNTQFDDLNPVLDKNNELFYFTSDRSGHSGMDKIFVMDLRKFPLTELGYAELPRPVNLVEKRILKDELPVEVKAAMKVELFFDFDMAALNTNNRFILDSLIGSWKNTNTIIKVAGYADDIGAADYNMQLSRRRAESVAFYLKEQGVPADKVAMSYYGAKERIPEVNLKNIKLEDFIKTQATNRRCIVSFSE